MISFAKHVVFKQTAYLLIIGSLLIVLFGSGLHLHSVFDHFFGHGDIHTFVHAHPANSDIDHNPEFDEKDAHQHPTATVDLTGTLTQNSKNNALHLTDIMTVSWVLSSQLFSQTPAFFFTDLPPPDFLHPSNYFPPLSLRGPPLG